MIEKALKDFEVPGLAVAMIREGDVVLALVMTVPGQAPYRLDPALGGWFDLKGLSGFRARFDNDAAGKVIALVLAQPNGVFTAKRK